MVAGEIIVIGKRCKGKPLALFFVTLALMMFFPFFLIASQNSDSLKNKYPVNDPRNPGCPCHKYQQTAIKEYEELLKQENKFHVFNGDKKNEVAGLKIKEKGKLFLYRPFVHLHKGHKRKPEKIKLKRFFFKKDVAACFKW